MQHRFKQTGMALIISLILLVSLTLLTLASMGTTRTDLSMAGNLRDSSTAFNAAEAGLRAGEQSVEASISAVGFNDPANGLLAETDPDPDYLNSATWASAPFVTTSPSLAHVAEQPRVVVKYLGERSNNSAAAVNIGGYGKTQTGKTVSHFRITVRGLGQTPNVARYVQAHFGKEY